MKQSRSLWLLVACIAILMSDVFFAGVALAALPPLSDEELSASADVVLTGTVQSEYHRIVTLDGPDGMTDRQWVLVVTVDSVRKGTLKVGQVVYLHGWNPEKRPAGFTGAGGHRWVPSPGQKGLFHVTQASNGKFSILDPNGASTLPTPNTP